MLHSGSIFLFTVLTLLVASCAPVLVTSTPETILTEEPSIPVTGTVEVEGLEIQVSQADPLQINAILRGQLPNAGCTTIDSVDQAREGNTIKLTVNTNSVNDPAVSCAQVLTPFEQVVALDISNLPPGTYLVNANGIEQSFELPAQTTEQFRQVLVDALNGRDYEKLKGLMEPTFMLAYWQSEGTANTPEQAVEQLQRNLLNSTSPIVADPGKDLVALLGINPITILGPDVVEASPLFTSGWGAEGKDSAILFIAKNQKGKFYWHGFLFAKDGFARPTPVAVTPVDTNAYPTQVKYVLALQDVRMRSGPGTQFSIIGFVAAGQTAKVTGISADRYWWRVICSDGSIGNCWVSAVSNLTQPSDGALPDRSVYPTSVQFVMAQKDVNLFSGPSTQYSVVGFIAGGQIAKVTGVNADSRWWRVICPDGSIGNCWVSADTSSTRPVDPVTGTADVQSVEVQVLENPVQATAIARGMLPDAGCTTIAGASQSRTGNTILVTLTTKRDPLALCAQMLTPFEYSISLDVSSLLPGRYSVNVNGVVVSFVLPGVVSYP